MKPKEIALKASFQWLLLLVLVACTGWNGAQAQEKWWVFFTDKDGVSFNPHTYFDANAIERRQKLGLPLNHFTDLPVRQDYLDLVALEVDSMSYATRWFNGVAVWAQPQQMDRVRQLPFVRAIEAMQTESKLAGRAKVLSTYDEKILRQQTARMGRGTFGEYDGTGIRVAIFDAGFPGVDTLAAFRHIRKEKRIIKTYDFVKKRDNAYGGNAHGTSVMSCIGGMRGDQPIGLATGAEFLLARTENAFFEPFSEEENWLAAVEWADKNGAHIINSSLGYTNRRYKTSDMDGRTSFVSRAANIAAAKGILVVNAAGNEGADDWKVIGTPADADSALSIGGIDPTTNYHISFSSFGPTADKRMKPNVCAFGNAMVANKNGTYNPASGTSFASPLVAGFAACAWQVNPEWNNMQLFREIEQSGDLYPYFDYAHGFGVPQARHFIYPKDVLPEPTFELKVDEAGIFDVVILPEPDGPEGEEGGENESEATSEDYLGAQYLYYHFENAQGYLDRYFVVQVDKPEVLTLLPKDLEGVAVLRIHYRGYTLTKTLK
ncbi:MAG: S8 family serine peptidase [Salibacteraceae bacterium]